MVTAPAVRDESESGHKTTAKVASVDLKKREDAVPALSLKGSFL